MVFCNKGVSVGKVSFELSYPLDLRPVLPDLTNFDEMRTLKR